MTGSGGPSLAAADAGATLQGDNVRIPLVEETAHIEKRPVVTGSVRVTTRTETREEVVCETLERERVEVRRIPVGRELGPGEAVPQVRTEGGMTIVPVFEEFVVVEKRLRLKEELHILRTTSAEPVEIPVPLRRQHAEVEHLTPDSAQSSHPEQTRGTIMAQTITALFDKRADAEAAIAKITALGIARADIRLLPDAEHPASMSGSVYDHERDDRGFWASLKDAFLPEEDRYSYSEGMHRGGTMVTVSADPAHVSQITDILEEHGSIDLDAREDSWRTAGWKGYAAPVGATTAGTTAAAGAAGALENASPARSRPAALRSEEAGAVAARGPTAADTDYIPIAEERINVGKRVVDRGRVRVRTFTVETPFSQQVNLRDETVHVDRRRVDRPVTAADETLFAGRTIEAEEHDEEAVVSKDVRVVEEVGIRKDAVNRTETIQDKLRHTEVEIEDGRTGAAAAPTGDPRPGAAAGLAAGLDEQRARDMEVVGSDDQHVGVVDHVQANQIKLKRMDSAAGGQHHLIPMEWVTSIDKKIMLRMTAAEAKSRWTAAG